MQVKVQTTSLPTRYQASSTPPAPGQPSEPEDSFDWGSRLKESAGPTLMSVAAAASTQLDGIGPVLSPFFSATNYGLGAIRLLDAHRTVKGKQPDGSKGPVLIAGGALGLAAGVVGIALSAKVGNTLPLMLVQLPAVAANVAAGIIDPQS